MGKRSAVVELFLGDMGSMQRELRPSTQREDQLTMETKLEQIAVKAANQLPKSVVREIRTPRSVGTRWDGKRGVGHRPQATAPILDSTKEDLARPRAMPKTRPIMAATSSGRPDRPSKIFVSTILYVPGQ